jgi:hypothetical protein
MYPLLRCVQKDAEHPLFMCFTEFVSPKFEQQGADSPRTLTAGDLANPQVLKRYNPTKILDPLLGQF